MIFLNEPIRSENDAYLFRDAFINFHYPTQRIKSFKNYDYMVQSIGGRYIYIFIYEKNAPIEIVAEKYPIDQYTNHIVPLLFEKVVSSGFDINLKYSKIV